MRRAPSSMPRPPPPPKPTTCRILVTLPPPLFPSLVCAECQGAYSDTSATWPSTCCVYNAIEPNVAATWTFTVAADGVRRIYKEGEVVFEGKDLLSIDAKDAPFAQMPPLPGAPAAADDTNVRPCTAAHTAGCTCFFASSDIGSSFPALLGSEECLDRM